MGAAGRIWGSLGALWERLGRVLGGSWEPLGSSCGSTSEHELFKKGHDRFLKNFVAKTLVFVKDRELDAQNIVCF